jgi:tetratricopeptide (TPR) repeat protein
MPAAHEIYDEAEKLKDAGKYPEAIEKYMQALAADPHCALPHFALAVVYGKVGNHEKAVQHAETAAQMEPQDPFSFTALSVTYQRAFAGTGNHQFIKLAEDAMARSHMIQGRRH